MEIKILSRFKDEKLLLSAESLPLSLDYHVLYVVS